MRITTLHKETNLTDIVDRLFANLTPETRRIAEKALMGANPELSNPEVLRPGTIIQVPEVPALKLKAARAEDDPVGQTREMLKESLRSYRSLLAKHLGAEKTELVEQAKLLDEILSKCDPPLDPEVTKITKDLQRNLDKRMEENKVRGNVLQNALGRALKDLGK